MVTLNTIAHNDSDYMYICLCIVYHLAVLHWLYSVCGNTDSQELEDLQNLLQQRTQRKGEIKSPFVCH